MSKPAPAPGLVVDRNLALELVRVTEAAALAASRWIGRGDKNAADGAAVEAMRKAFDTVAITGTVVIGEGEMDEAPMLYIGEKVGAGGPKIDIALDPLEGTTITAKAGRCPNAPGVLARGSLEGEFWWKCERGMIIAYALLAPTTTPQLQALEWRWQPPKP